MGTAIVRERVLVRIKEEDMGVGTLERAATLCQAKLAPQRRCSPYDNGHIRRSQ